MFLKKTLSIIYEGILWKIRGLGSMKQYYKISKWCEKKERNVESDAKFPNKKRIYRSIILNYAKLVGANPFIKEKKNENEEIWRNIRNGKLGELFPEEVGYIMDKEKLLLYPYKFIEKYKVNEKDVLIDEKIKNLSYVWHNGKRLFFPREEHKNIAEKYLQLITEQDIESPHRYFHDIDSCDVFVDVGSAEGIISLEYVEKSDEIFLLECSEKWISALEQTFLPYKEKIHLVRKYSGSYDDKSTITLDTLLRKYKNKRIVIKMDIEGMELDALQGAKETMKNNYCLFSCATYHTNSAYDELKMFFESNGYLCSTTDKYMLFIYGNMTLANGKYQRMEFPYFRHGIIRAEKQE